MCVAMSMFSSGSFMTVSMICFMSMTMTNTVLQRFLWLILETCNKEMSWSFNHTALSECKKVKNRTNKPTSFNTL